MLQESERFFIRRYDIVCTARGKEIDAKLPSESVFMSDFSKVRTFSKIS